MDCVLYIFYRFTCILSFIKVKTGFPTVFLGVSGGCFPFPACNVHFSDLAKTYYSTTIYLKNPSEYVKGKFHDQKGEYGQFDIINDYYSTVKRDRGFMDKSFLQSA